MATPTRPVRKAAQAAQAAPTAQQVPGAFPTANQFLTIPKDAYDQLQANLYTVANAIGDHLREREQRFVDLQYGYTQCTNAYQEAMARQSTMSNEIAKLRYALREAEHKAAAEGQNDSQSQILAEDAEWHKRQLQEAESLLTSLGYERRDKGWVRCRGSRRARKTVIPE